MNNATSHSQHWGKIFRIHLYFHTCWEETCFPAKLPSNNNPLVTQMMQYISKKLAMAQERKHD